jgi:hypothetical protein
VYALRKKGISLMGMRPTLFSLNDLAVELGVNIRTISAALRSVPPDGSIEIKCQSYDAWRLATALRALSRRHGNSGHYTNLERAAAVEAALDDVIDGFRQLEAEPDVGERRKLVGEIGPCIGALDRAIEASAPDGLGEVVRPFRDRFIGELIGRLLDACEWELSVA